MTNSGNGMEFFFVWEPPSILIFNLPISDDDVMSRGGMNDGFIWERLVPVNNVNDGYDFAYDLTLLARA